jgi:PAS domain S-box-containing protein
VPNDESGDIRRAIPLSKEFLSRPRSHEQEQFPLPEIVERYGQILHAASETAIITIDTEGLVTGWSEGALQILGWSESEMLGQSLARIIPAENDGDQLLKTEIADALSKGKGGSEGWRLRKGGERFWGIGETKPLFHGPDPIGVVKILRDRTEERLTETALREQTRALEILNRTGGVLARETDLNVLVQAVLEAGVALSSAEFGAFFYNVVDPAGESYMLYTIAGAPRDAFAQFPMPRNTAVFAPTFSGEGIVRSDDIPQDPRYGKNAPHAGMPDGPSSGPQLSRRSYHLTFGSGAWRTFLWPLDAWRLHGSIGAPFDRPCR